MARKFTRRRWRRPQRMTLEGPAPSRRKDLVIPDVLTLEPELAWQDNRGRMARLLIAFLGLALVEGIVVGVVFRTFAAPALAVLLAFAYLAVGSRFGDAWMQRVLKAAPCEWTEAETLLKTVAARTGVSTPSLYEAPGEAPNALALGLRRRWLVVTNGSRRLPRLELEALLAHETVHLRDGDAALASAWVLLAGAVDLGMKALWAPWGFLALLAVPLWPACVALRAARSRLFSSDREHRADVSGALVTRYPPGMRQLLEGAAVEHGATPLGAADGLWFAPRTSVSGPGTAERARLVSEM